MALCAEPSNWPSMDCRPWSTVTFLTKLLPFGDPKIALRGGGLVRAPPERGGGQMDFRAIPPSPGKALSFLLFLTARTRLVCCCWWCTFALLTARTHSPFAGPGGDDVEMAVAAGDRALLSKYAGDKLFTPDGEEYVCVPQSDLMGIL